MTATHAAFDPGDIVGRWQVVGELGRGSFGAVYRVSDTAGLLPDGALKNASDKFGIVASQQDEIRLLASVRHTNILGYLDSKIPTSPSEVCYFVAPLAEETLQEAVDREGDPLAREHTIAAALADIANALDYLHSLDPPIVHRDVKPSNILRVGNRWLLGDLGIAIAQDATARNGERFTGSPSFMSADQWAGFVSTENDMFALGAVAHYLLTGESIWFDPAPLDGAERNGRISPSVPTDWFFLIRELCFTLPFERRTAAWAARMFRPLASYGPFPYFGWDARELEAIRFDRELDALATIRAMRVLDQSGCHKRIYELAKELTPVEFKRFLKSDNPEIECWFNLYALRASLALGLGKTVYATDWLTRACQAQHKLESPDRILLDQLFEVERTYLYRT